MHPMQKHGCVRRGGTNPVCEDLTACNISRSTGEALENPTTGRRSTRGEGGWVVSAVSPHSCSCGPNRHVYLVFALFVPPRDKTNSPPAVWYFYSIWYSNSRSQYLPRRRLREQAANARSYRCWLLTLGRSLIASKMPQHLLECCDRTKCWHGVVYSSRWWEGELTAYCTPYTPVRSRRIRVYAASRKVKFNIHRVCVGRMKKFHRDTVQVSRI